VLNGKSVAASSSSAAGEIVASLRLSGPLFSRRRRSTSALRFFHFATALFEAVLISRLLFFSTGGSITRK